MRIGFDAKRIFRNSTGLGNYGRTLVNDIAHYFPEHKYYLFAADARSENLFPQNVDIIGPHKIFPAYWRSFGITKTLMENKIDIYHGLSNEIPFSLRKTNIKTVVTIHDLIFKHYPAYYPYTDRNIYELKTKYACKHADMIIATSEATKRDIISMYSVNEDRIAVVYQSCNKVFYENIITPDSVQEKYNLPEDFLLYVGSLSERKNVLNICHAYLHIPEQHRIPCIVIGRGGDYAQKIDEFVRKNGLSDYFIFLDHIKDDELPGFYRLATAFIYPSLYEGFGIPVLEALAIGCPVITSNISSMPEVAGEAAIYIDPENAEDIALKIQSLIHDVDLRLSLKIKGKIQAEKFTAQHITADIMNVYEKLS